MRAVLVRKPVIFTGIQAKAIATGFSDYVNRSGLQIYACAVMPDHAHLVVGKFRLPIERICEQLKGAATAQLNREKLHPFEKYEYANGRLPTPWARKGWWVYLNDDADVLRSVRYVNNNPIREGLKMQRWSFVTAFGE